MILIDVPRWEAHGTAWAHVVSDTSLSELHAFARATGIPTRSFDLDHYDVPRERYDELLRAGAVPVSRRELVAALAGSGLRVRGRDRAASKRSALAARWERTLPGCAGIGAELLERWHEPHRVYHGPAHLGHALDSLVVLSPGRGARPDDAACAVVERLALWFHDAVYTGPGLADTHRPGGASEPSDEEASAQLAADLLGPIASRSGQLTTADVDEVTRLVLLTAAHDPGPDDASGARVSDADLAILASAPDRYARYVTQVRAEYAAIPDAVFAAGRRRILTALLDAGPVFRSPVGHERWEERGRANLHAEVERLAADER